MYLWQIEYNKLPAIPTGTELWIALNYVSLTDWIQRVIILSFFDLVVNRFKLCIFDRLNTTQEELLSTASGLWIALNYVSLTDWIQLLSSVGSEPSCCESL